MKNYKKFIADEEHIFNDSKAYFNALYKGETIYGYHGTNRDFDEFDIDEIRKLRLDRFTGKEGIYFSIDYDVAVKYAHSNMNDSLPLSIIDKAKDIDENLYYFMYGLYHKGNVIWSDELHIS